MEDIIVSLVLQALEVALTKAIETGITYIIKKTIDAAGNMITEIVYEYDSDGDGENDSEQVIYTLDTLIPSLDDGYCLCNKGDEIGLGIPQYKVLDGFNISEFIDSDIITGNDNGFIVDFDGDGANDDVLVPLPDFTGDGQSDWGWLVDDDDNGLPDVSPFSPFYPVGSEGYHEIVERVSDSDLPFMDKPFEDFTVTEGLLFLILICVSGSFLGRLFKRRVIL